MKQMKQMKQMKRMKRMKRVRWEEGPLQGDPWIFDQYWSNF
jgi:hypothetical protein